ncbi:MULTISPECIES: protein tyrosine phosphatase family protein [Pseudomonas]|uniref:Protein tyrosine phosphatase (PTP) superfamily phosphohydrolase (DUF442 family) n=1 Tax=Phytopseudomonas flavescens TaxID=29435 RepID=A0A7Y9XJH6_9GAMM|nr:MULTISPECIES: protein tyrosine phosphatase family protein [Pseudomonas]MCW2293043.1 protein tyrosine phosphatase (PTP) superfamily phosphohydrolase (DUF442 family) [Pseudomonas sp. BIGb0408]NYH72387.1 protein tyrosine phosphatase (PTP) superfamily phosphohydrolase (DUF442 family) [Pseudomonas flavescens]
MVHDIKSLRIISESVWTAGQPSKTELVALHELGFALVMNIAPIDPRYSLPNEQELVQSLGMRYVHQPVSFQNPTIADFELFAATLDELRSERMLIHCAANYRVSVFYGVYAMSALGWSAQQCQALIGDVWNIEEFPVWDALARKLMALQEQA